MPMWVPAAAVGLLAWVQLACTGSSGDKLDTVEAAKPPLRRVTQYGDHLSIDVAPGTDWRSLVRISIFGGFRPGQTCEEARASTGPALREGTNHRGRYCEYDLSESTARLAWEETSSGWGAVSSEWVLHAQPRNLTTKSFFHPSIANEIVNRSPPASLVTVAEADGDPRIHVHLQGDRVIDVKWLRVGEAGQEEAPTAPGFAR